MSGDIAGWGQVKGLGGGINYGDCSVCAKLCNELASGAQLTCFTGTKVQKLTQRTRSMQFVRVHVRRRPV
jgi:hypothetical protein